MTNHKKQEELYVQFLERNDFKGLENYLIENSNLPGRMVNLRLIATVANFFESNEELSKSWYRIFNSWFDIKIDGNSPEIILVLTALESFGGIYQNFSRKEQLLIEKKLKDSLNDERWRVREIVTESYKRIGLLSYGDLIKLFEDILSNDPTPLEVRGLLATVAHPNLLILEEQLDFSQKILELFFHYYLNFDEKTFSKEDKLILKKGLSFAPSVIVSKNPTVGFQYFDKLIKIDDKEINTIIKTNLKKKRLENVFPDEVEILLSEINK
ncbi:hypothetical protein [Vagococcus bubulae]|uniref:hypothetical protein n=1 Tax=Vagococcus bubulae TaxID=1977868 RepID=UPI0022E8F5C8|nr:hypothetical protein [Vagococcus bubulae]